MQMSPSRDIGTGAEVSVRQFCIGSGSRLVVVVAVAVAAAAGRYALWAITADKICKIDHDCHSDCLAVA